MSGAAVSMLLLYADEFAIFVADKIISIIETLFKKGLGVISNHLVDSKLLLHSGKTE